MDSHVRTRGLLIVAISIVALACAPGVARADDPVIAPTVPGIINQILIDTPVLSSDPRDRDGPRRDLGGIGMQCENLWARCR